nr:MAG TPA: hypothetical protein [Caudoviricetes sp.]
MLKLQKPLTAFVIGAGCGLVVSGLLYGRMLIALIGILCVLVGGLEWYRRAIFSNLIVTERNRMYFLYLLSMLMGALSIVLGVTLSVAAIAAGQWYLAPVSIAVFSVLAWMIWDLWRL